MSTQTRQKLSPSEIAAALERDPLVGVTVAARMIGKQAPNFRRDVAPHITRVVIDGTATFYFTSEVLAWGRSHGIAARRNGARSG